MKQLSKHLNFANAISCVALFVALSGAAYAAKATLGNKAVKTRNLANGAVSTLKLRSGAVTTLKLRNGAVTGAKIAPGAVGSTQLADGGVRSSDLGGGVVTEGKLKSGAVTEEKIASNAVTASKIAANAVTSSKLSGDSVATGKLQDGAVSAAKLNPGLLAQLVKNVSYVSKASPKGGGSQTATAECPAGKQVIGGGYGEIGTAEAVMPTESAPFVAGDGKRTGWRVSAIKDGGDLGELEIEAHAICAEF